MSTTTQILFNSPALHSLKRDQLVKLCKIHSIKASGKNVELIQKLRIHAQTLPKDSPLSIAARSEEHGPIPMQVQIPEPQEEVGEQEVGDDASYLGARSRPSEQWEMVMDSIEELEEESSQGTLRSQRTLGHNGVAGEFGTGGSKSTTVSSSIKAIATSLGLKKGNSKSTPASTTSSMKIAAFTPQAVQEATDELSQMSTPYSSIPASTSLPQTDHFTLNNARMSIDGNTDAPLPGHILRPGVPAPANARLSMGVGAPSTPSRPTTTIRLISNPLSNPGPSVDHSYASGENGTPQLKPFKTSFDITFGSPALNGSGFNFSSLNTWPPRGEEDVEMKGIYPTLSFDDLPPSLEMKPPGTPAKAGDIAVHQSLAVTKSPDVFVFGTPHKVTDDQFRSAAASVLEDLNRQLREDGVEEIENDIISKLHPGSKKEPPREIKPIPASKRGEITDKFQRLHEDEFQKMEGIDSLVKRRGEKLVPKKMPGDGEKVVLGKKRKSSALGRGGLGSRRPSGITARRASNTRVISNGRRAKALPGAFSVDDDDDDDEQEEIGGKRVRMDPESALLPEEEKKEQGKAEQRRMELEREKEAIRKKLEANRARRRSSAAHGGISGRKSGRLSVGKPRQSILVKPKPKPAKFGFLSSAKSLVQSVWNRGGKAPASAVAGPSNIPKPSAVASKPEPVKEKMGPPSFVATKKSSVAPTRASAAVASGNRGRSVRISDAKKAEDVKSLSSTRGSIASSSRSRSPLPAFTGTSGSSRNSLQSNASTQTSRTSSILSPGSRMSSIAGTAASRSRVSPTNVSSIGTRLSSATGMSAIGDLGSMGVRNVAGRKSVASRSSAAGTSSSRISNASSRLFAPTASSLAKMARSPPPGANGSNKLGSITNSPTVAASPGMSTTPNASGPFSPRQGGIFSKPLLLSLQSGIPTPVKRRLLSDEATTSATGEGDSQSKDQDKTSASSSTLARTRSLNGRKPRISRSKVIARLASQRAAGGSGTRPVGVSTIAPRVSNAIPAVTGARVVSGGKTRSSLGAKVSRASYGGGTRSRPSVGTSGGVVMSAKKRARQSEYARRRSKVGPLNFDGIAPKGVDVDMN